MKISDNLPFLQILARKNGDFFFLMVGQKYTAVKSGL